MKFLPLYAVTVWYSFIIIVVVVNQILYEKTLLCSLRSSGVAASNYY